MVVEVFKYWCFKVKFVLYGKVVFIIVVLEFRLKVFSVVSFVRGIRLLLWFVDVV